MKSLRRHTRPLLLLGVLVIGGSAYVFANRSVLVSGSAQAAGLAEAQIQAVLNLLFAFNVPAETVTTVNDILHNKTPAGDSAEQEAPADRTPAPNGGDTAPPPAAAKEPAYPVMQNPSQSVSVDGYNVYSPAPVLFGAQPRLYFGGWKNSGETHDNIYVADCPYGSGACSNARAVIDAAANGFEHLNDPTIVRMSGNPAYYIMYTTGVLAGQNGYNLDSNKIYYSTSWADDGINWSKPALLMGGFWLPSATLKDGHVILFANSTSDGRVAKFDLGASGVQVGAPAYGTFDNTGEVPPYYSNVDVVWRAGLNSYQMVAERLLSTAAESSSVIDYLTSKDGVSWHLQYPSVIRAAPGQFRVGSPAQWPDSAQWVYFGSTAQRDSMGFKVNFAQWNPQ